MKPTETVRILNRGKSFEYSRWEPLIQYTNDCFKQDFVSYKNCILACVKSHLSDPNNEPSLQYGDLENRYLVTGVDSEYWELVIPYTPGVIYIPNYNEETGELTWSISNKPEDVPSTLIDNFVWRKPEGLTSASLGKDNIIEGNHSMVAGEGLEVKNDGEVAFGKYNKSVSNTKFTIGVGDSNIRKNAVEVTDEGEVYIKGIGNYDGTKPNSSEDLSTAIKNLVEITYTGLVILRDNSALTPGRLYRITDYITTTIQANTQSANHQFDIIVLALSENKLSEQSWAIQHKGDTYFTNSKLSAWKIWYCLDNDTNRFAWADNRLDENNNEKGKGVIYRMIDEYNNDCPYDFKNIQFYRKWNSSESLWSTTAASYIKESVPCYTFSSSGNSSTTVFIDMSLVSSNNIYSNVIKECAFDRQTLSDNCFFGINCNYNTFGNDCNHNTFGNGCSNNAFGNDCNYNTFGNGYSNNAFGNGCCNNAFGNSCDSNTFGNGCNYNTFGTNCDSNTFGTNCDSNTFGAKCNHNIFGNGCKYIKFASDGLGSTKYTYYRQNRFGDGCQHIVFKGAGTADFNNQLQNYNFVQGLQGNSSNYITVYGKRNRYYETTVAQDSNGELKTYCLADIIDNEEDDSQQPYSTIIGEI